MSIIDFIVEDGSGVVGATSYINYQYLLDYAAYYDNPDIADMDESAFERKAVKASRWFDQQMKWKSTKLNPDQGLQFPRTDIGLPDPVKECVMAAIISMDSGVDLYKSAKRLTAQTFGNSSETYAGSYSEDDIPSLLKEALALIRAMGLGAKGFSQIEIVRG